MIAFDCGSSKLHKNGFFFFFFQLQTLTNVMVKSPITAQAINFVLMMSDHIIVRAWRGTTCTGWHVSPIKLLLNYH